MEDFEQQMERFRRKFHERQQRFDEQWELLRKKQQEKDERVCKSLSNLVQSIREFQRVTNPSSAAPQVFDEKSEQKLELADFKFQGKTEDVLEQPSPRKLVTAEIVKESQFEALQLQMEKKDLLGTNLILVVNQKISDKKKWMHSKEVPPLDVSGLLSCFVRQSGPISYHLGVRKAISNKMVKNVDVNELVVRIASVLQSTRHCYKDGFWTDLPKHSPSNEKRHVAIVMTLSLPWMRDNVVNPPFGVAYLAKSEKQNVTLVVPWLCKSDQELMYHKSVSLSSVEEQESYIRSCVEDMISFKADFKISFYSGKFSKERRSIIRAGDTSQFISLKETDVVILEEPERLNWYHHGKHWISKFNHVIGVIHTNYLEYTKREKNGVLKSFLGKRINRAYYVKVLRLSAATHDFHKFVVCNVNGVNPKFLKIGETVVVEMKLGQQAFSKGAYSLGNMVWAKGYNELIDLLAKQKSELDGFNLDGSTRRLDGMEAGAIQWYNHR
ncbi:digalactosyldiacylglycerol synthase 1, chloroplastic-like [Euphorbia lathyris]|uniref:digalactosyldiacylglycerol synthase 1, chloroplastic-like n=1 Tax=Euphorbia lathyris TaxID=212925 RepID=UPI0033132CF5